MSANSRFVVAVHVLAGLTIVKLLNKESSITSERIAWSVNTNPVVVRRIMGLLREGGLVTSQAGAVGGSQLARDARKITLQDIYNAVEEGELFKSHFREPNKDCPVGANILPALEGVLEKAETAMRFELEKVTIEQIARNIMVLSGRSFDHIAS